MEYKQPAIAEELKRRISEGIYQDYIPKSSELADEFQVNIKTIHKAVAILVEQHLLERKKRIGTRIVKKENTVFPQKMVEVIFEGFTTIFTHPFWNEIWEGMMQKFAAAGYHPVLNCMNADPQTGVLQMDNFTLCPSSCKVILGISEKRLLDQVAASKVPFITACDPIEDKRIPQVIFDYIQGIQSAVDFLYQSGCRKIGFIGQTSSFINMQLTRKFNIYLNAIQKYTQIDPALIENVRPLAESGENAVKNMLKRKTPDALIAAYDHQLPGICQALKEMNLSIPVIGCDGIVLPMLDPERHTVKVPRRRCGEVVAEQLIHAVNIHRKPRSVILNAEFI